MCTPSGEILLAPAPIEAETRTAFAKRSWRKAIGRFRERLHRRRQLQDLVELDDRLLADIGITREQALNAVKDPRWARLAQRAASAVYTANFLQFAEKVRRS